MNIKKNLLLLLNIIYSIKCSMENINKVDQNDFIENMKCPPVSSKPKIVDYLPKNIPEIHKIEYYRKYFFIDEINIPEHKSRENLVINKQFNGQNKLFETEERKNFNEKRNFFKSQISLNSSNSFKSKKSEKPIKRKQNTFIKQNDLLNSSKEYEVVIVENEMDSVGKSKIKNEMSENANKLLRQRVQIQPDKNKNDIKNMNEEVNPGKSKQNNKVESVNKTHNEQKDIFQEKNDMESLSRKTENPEISLNLRNQMNELHVNDINCTSKNKFIIQNNNIVTEILSQKTKNIDEDIKNVDKNLSQERIFKREENQLYFESQDIQKHVNNYNSSNNLIKITNFHAFFNDFRKTDIASKKTQDDMMSLIKNCNIDENSNFDECKDNLEFKYSLIFQNKEEANNISMNSYDQGQDNLVTEIYTNQPNHIQKDNESCVSINIKSDINKGLKERNTSLEQKDQYEYFYTENTINVYKEKDVKSSSKIRKELQELDKILIELIQI